MLSMQMYPFAHFKSCKFNAIPENFANDFTMKTIHFSRNLTLNDYSVDEEIFFFIEPKKNESMKSVQERNTKWDADELPDSKFWSIER